METKTKFKDLNGFLKTTVVITWIIFGLTILGFLVGFIEGLLGL